MVQMFYCSVNGQNKNELAINDRGLSYGDGVFTTAKVVNGKICQLNAHMQRLKVSCEKLKLAVPDINAIEQELTTAARQYAQAVAKVIITAGQGGRGYSRQGIANNNVIISFSSFPQHYLDWQQDGITMGISEYQLGINSHLAGIKHLNRLEQVLIRHELDARAEDDILVTNCNGIVVEGSSANVFWLKNNVWYTPKLVDSGVKGLKRQQILSKLAHLYQFEERQATLDELDDIQAMIITNCVMDVIPVHTFNNISLSIEASKVLAIALNTVSHE